jgi:chaperonin GroES
MSANKKPSITPLHDRVIIKPDPVKKKTEGGLIIPDSVAEKPIQGKVIAAGSGTKDKPLTVKVGNAVLYSKHVGTPIQVDNEGECLIMRESDVLAIV